MLPALASRFNPALSVMQSITTWHEQEALKQQQQSGQTGAPITPLITTPSAARAQATESISKMFSVHHVTPTELMIRMTERIAGRLNSELAANADNGNDAPGEAQNKSDWRERALNSDYRDMAARGELSIPQPDDATFRQVARMILNIFNEDFLDTHSELKKELEDMIGFRLNGISVLDLLRAVVEPDSKLGEKVENALANGLAGMEGSKVLQRLERAGQGAQTVEAAIADALNTSPIDEVAPETKAEDQEAIENAKVQAKLEEVLDMQDRAHEVSETDRAEQDDDPWDIDSLTLRAYADAADTSEDDEDELKSVTTL